MFSRLAAFFVSFTTTKKARAVRLQKEKRAEHIAVSEYPERVFISHWVDKNIIFSSKAQNIAIGVFIALAALNILLVVVVLLQTL